MRRDARDELLQRGSGARPVPLRHGDVGGELDRAVGGLGRVLGQVPAKQRDRFAARGIFIEQPPNDREALVDAVRP